MTTTAPTLVDILPAHRFDEAALAAWLRDNIEGFDGPIAIRQFQGGQSNPTFLLTAAAGRRCVLRKKPPGTLLAKAHQVEREFRVMGALRGTAVPVPAMLALCEDETVIGTAFYVMAFVDGRAFDHPALRDAPHEERRRLHESAVDTLAALHSVEPAAVGLGDFGPGGNYVLRQVQRWSRQYDASLIDGPAPSMAWLRDWLTERADVPEERTIVHGDYRFGNLLFEKTFPGVAAVLDWELATLGHPLSDLAYYCMPYRIPADRPNERGVQGLDLAGMNLPTETETLDRYCRRVGRTLPGNWPVFLALSFFRLAAIIQGVYARAVQGNASDGNALKMGARVAMLAEAGVTIARESQL